MGSDLRIGVLPRAARPSKDVYAGQDDARIYVNRDGIVMVLAGTKLECLEFAEVYFGCELDPVPAPRAFTQNEQTVHYRDVLVALFSDQHYRPTADSVLNELHQAGWRVVPR